jgi:hypothetical protein
LKGSGVMLSNPQVKIGGAACVIAAVGAFEDVDSGSHDLTVAGRLRASTRLLRRLLSMTKI